jgi:hypothetical protein
LEWSSGVVLYTWVCMRSRFGNCLRQLGGDAKCHSR